MEKTTDMCGWCEGQHCFQCNYTGKSSGGSLYNKIVKLGGIRYKVRFVADSYIVLTKPHGKVEYIAPKDPNTGKVVGLPITKGLIYAGYHAKN